MKKFILLLYLGLVNIVCNAQVYSKIMYYDKFDDVLETEVHKTLITQTDTTFIIEEKGREPVTYYIMNIIESGTRGSKDDVVNLTGNIYGYETTWCVVRNDMLDKYYAAKVNYLLDPTDENLKKLYPFWIFAVKRIITTQYTGTYQTEYFWLYDESSDGRLGKDVSRIIYTNN